MNTIIEKSKKIVALSIAISMFAWSFGLTGVSFAVAAQPGDLIKMQCTNSVPPVSPTGCDAVYYLGSDGNRYVFPNSKIYFSWYNDFSAVQTVSKAELESYSILIGAASNVTYRPGTRLVKFITDPKVYAVDSNGTLRHVASEQVAMDIWGADWAKQVDDLSDAFGAGYVEGSAINGSGDFDPAAAMAGSPNINADKALAQTPGGGGGGGTVTVSLAADTPASIVVPQNAARVMFTKVNLTASASGDAVIDSWVVSRGGLGADSAFSGVDIIDASTMLPINDLAKTFNSNHTANFTDDFTIPAGMTKSVYITGNMAASLSGNSGETPTLGLQSITLKGGGSVAGTLPAVGNPMTLNSSLTIGTATVQRGAYSNATSTALEVGKKDYTFFSFQVQAGSAEEVTFGQVRVYQVGSAALASDLGNIRLLQDGVEIAKGTVSGLYINFTFSPIVIPKGQIKQFQVKADLLGGSNRTVKLAIYRTTDLLVKGTTYNHFITPTYSGTGSGTTQEVLTDNQHTISQGTLRVGRSSTVAATNITVGPDQVIGAFEFDVKGEPVDITALTLTIASSGTATIEDALQSVRLVDSNGATIAGPQDVTNNALTVAFSSTFTMPVGISHVKVVGNLALNGGWATNDTISASLQTPATQITARGQETNLSITATPSSNVLTSTQTVKAANLTVSKNSTPTNKTVITNDVNVLAGSWSFDATNSGEDIRVTSIALKASSTTHMDKLTLKDGSTVLDPINEITTASTFGAPVTSTFALTQPLIIPKGTQKTLDLFVDIGSGSAAGEVSAFALDTSGSITATGVTTGNSATITAIDSSGGAQLTISAAGTLSITLDASSGANRIVIAGTQSETLSEIRLKATNENIDITRLIVRVADGALTGTAAGDQDEISKFWLKLDGAVVGNASGYNLSAATQTVNLDRGALTIPSGNTGKKLSIVAEISQIGTNEPGTNHADVTLGLNGANAFTATGNGSNQSATISYTDSTGSAVIIHKGAPQVVIKVPSNQLASTAVLHEVDITAVGDDIGLFRTSYVISTSASLQVTNVYTRLKTCNGCGGISNGQTLSDTGVAASPDYETATEDIWALEFSNTVNSSKRYLNIATGATASIELIATVNGLTTNVDSVTTRFLGDGATSTNDTSGDPTAAFTLQNGGNFVWSDLQVDDSQAASSLTAKQWFNGYLVDGLGTTISTTPITVGE